MVLVSAIPLSVRIGAYEYKRICRETSKKAEGLKNQTEQVKQSKIKNIVKIFVTQVCGGYLSEREIQRTNLYSNEYLFPSVYHVT